MSLTWSGSCFSSLPRHAFCWLRWSLSEAGSPFFSQMVPCSSHLSPSLKDRRASSHIGESQRPKLCCCLWLWPWLWRRYRHRYCLRYRSWPFVVSLLGGLTKPMNLLEWQFFRAAADVEQVSIVTSVILGLLVVLKADIFVLIVFMMLVGRVTLGCHN